jgi:endonuclease VIII-like 1
MPELAELRLTADYINQTAKGKIFHNVRKNPTHKCPEISEELDFPFIIKAESKGKELMLEITPQRMDGERKYLMMTMGMSGHFKWLVEGTTHKHAHLIFNSDGGSLAFVDVRRFGKWKWGSWGNDRGPDPTTDFQNFIRNIKNNLHKNDFNKPICEVLMNQKYFNGIGNYLRAEILYRVNVNPFIPAREALTSHSEIYELCRWAPLQAYKLGGGVVESYRQMLNSWEEFILCYNRPNMSKVKDKNGRTFWYDKKWDI